MTMLWQGRPGGELLEKELNEDKAGEYELGRRGRQTIWHQGRCRLCRLYRYLTLPLSPLSGRPGTHPVCHPGQFRDRRRRLLRPEPTMDSRFCRLAVCGRHLRFLSISFRAGLLSSAGRGAVSLSSVAVLPGRLLAKVYRRPQSLDPYQPIWRYGNNSRSLPAALSCRDNILPALRTHANRAGVCRQGAFRRHRS